MSRLVPILLVLALSGCGKESKVGTRPNEVLKIESFAGFWQVVKETTGGIERDLSTEDRAFFAFKKAEMIYVAPKSAKEREVQRTTYLISGKNLTNRAGRPLYRIDTIEPGRLKITVVRNKQTGILEPISEAEFNAAVEEAERMRRQ